MTHTNEVKKLDAIYQSAGNNFVMLYGRLGCGKEALLDEFTTGKSYFYYRSRQCSDAKQLMYLDDQISSTYGKANGTANYEEAFKKFSSKDGSKLIVIIDEAQYAIKKSNDLFKSLVALKNKKLYPGKVMIIVVSSSLVWTENAFNEIVPDAKSVVDDVIKMENHSGRQMPE